MKFTKAIISLSRASLALAAPSNQLHSVDGTRRGYVCCYDDGNISSNSRNCDVYPTDSNRGNRIDYRCVPSEDLIQLLTEDGGRGGPLGGSDEGDFRTYLAGNNFRIILSEIDPDFNNNGRVGSGNSGGLLAGLDGILSSLGL